MTERRFPPPWSAEVTSSCLIVRDSNGQQLAYVYYESESGQRSAAKLLTKDEARRIAAFLIELKLTCEPRVGPFINYTDVQLPQHPNNIAVPRIMQNLLFNRSE